LQRQDDLAALIPAGKPKKKKETRKEKRENW
jgi:hypothetical protein